jgi:thymidylate synthase (FAD)
MESAVRLVDHMGNDAAIVQAARVSYGEGTKSTSEDRQLIRYLMRHWHTTPFEMVEFKFHIRVPIFVARQWLRHRTASVNELSARYSVVKDDFWVPSTYRYQKTGNTQMSGTDAPHEDESATMSQMHSCRTAFDVYQGLIERGIAREIARTHLPQSTFTEFYWKIDLHNLFHFLHLRMDDHAQPEIQECAVQVFDCIREIVPMACEAFMDYHVKSVTLTGPEIQALKTSSAAHLSKGEVREFEQKCQRLGLKESMTSVAESTSTSTA